MNQNKIIVSLTASFSILYLIFIIWITRDFSTANSNVLQSKNVIDVTDFIHTRIKISSPKEDIAKDWFGFNFDDSEWQKIKIPRFQIVQLQNFKEGNLVFYRIKVPKETFRKIRHLKNETSLFLQSIYFQDFDIYINGKFFRSYRPLKPSEYRVVVPLIEDIDNIISVRGIISKGNTGIDSRNKIMLGKGVEFNEVFSAQFKGQTAFQLVFILCKGSILFIFGLIYFQLSVEKSFEKFLIFGLCAVMEELIAGDYFYSVLDFNQTVYFYNAVNVVGTFFLYLFFCDLLNTKFNIKNLYIFFCSLTIISFILSADALYWNRIFGITTLIKFWNLITASVLSLFLLKVYGLSRMIFFLLALIISLYVTAVFFSSNIGLNLKVYGNLLLFVMVAFYTFKIFRREQVELTHSNLTLLEQEKDVAIGKIAMFLAHDVRKPLEQIKVVLDTLIANKSKDEFLAAAKKDLELSLSNVDHQINDIMNFSSSKKVELLSISFYEILAHSVKQVMSIHQGMNLNLEYHFNAHVELIGNQQLLSGLLVNLISNAVEAIREIGKRSQGTISFYTVVENNYFIIKIFNDGPEIPEATLQNIYKPHYTSGKPKGTGLGLASVLKSVNEQKGLILVLNVPGAGVEFTLKIPSSPRSDKPDRYDFKMTSNEYSYSYSYSYSYAQKKDEQRLLHALILESKAEQIHKIKTSLTISDYTIEYTILSDVEKAFDSIRKKRYDIYIINSEFDINKRYLSEFAFLHPYTVSYPGVLPSNFQNSLTEILLKRKKILFVDDTRLFRIAWESFHGKHNIECIGSPEEALSVLSSGSTTFDIFVLDFYFSNSSITGLELAEKIRNTNKEAIILLSTSVENEKSQYKVISKTDYDVRKYI